MVKKKKHLSICWESLHSSHQLAGDGTCSDENLALAG
jgi:hypothetical protein